MAMTWSKKTDCQSWGSCGKVVGVVGDGLVRSVKKRWAMDGCRHERNTVLLDWGSGMSLSRRVMRWRNC